MSDIIRYTETEEIGKNKISAIQRVLYNGWPIHWHEYYEIEYIVSGNGTYVINNIEYPMTPGSLFFMTPLDFSSIINCESDPVTLINISFTESWISDRIMDSVTSYAVINNYPDILCTRILEELSSNKKHSSNFVRSALTCILIDATRSAKSRSNNSKASKSDMVITDMLTYIHTHFREDLTLSILSEYIGLTPNYLSKIFASYIGMPFKAYVIDLKLKYATALLTQTNTSITDICYLCGFNSSALFFRTFKSKYNISPLRYRKEHRYQSVYKTI